MSESRKSLIERLFVAKQGALRIFFRNRVRTGGDVQDLAQEVYLRMLRVSDAEVIRNPEAYLFTVARNLAREQALLENLQRGQLDVEAASLETQLADLPQFENDADATLRTRRLREVLLQLPPKCRTAVVLQYRDGLSYAEIAKQLGVSTHMVKKYLAKGLSHCRKRMSEFG